MESSTSSLSSKKELLLESLGRFFKNENNMDHMLPIINGDSKISLRTIDWFVTNYAKKNDTFYIIKRNGSEQEQFIVHLNYKSQLKAYSKKQFDPFCRQERITFKYKQGSSLTTTVGQLNFFRWAIENNVLAHIQKHLKDIEDDMNVRNAHNKKKQSKKNVAKKNNKKGAGTNVNTTITDQVAKTRRKRHELSVSATKSVSKYNVPITLKFE